MGGGRRWWLQFSKCLAMGLILIYYLLIMTLFGNLSPVWMMGQETDVVSDESHRNTIQCATNLKLMAYLLQNEVFNYYCHCHRAAG